MSFLSCLFEMLNENTSYAILRNWQGLPEHCSSRDIDIIIAKSKYIKVEQKIFEIAKDNSMCLVQRFHSERFYTLIYGNIEDYSLVQLDFFFHCSTRGIIIMDAEEMLKGRVCENGVYHVSEDIVFLDKYMFNTLLGHKYPDKYHEIKVRAEENPDVHNKLMEILGIADIDAISKLGASKLRQKVFAYSCKKHLFRQLKNTLAFVGANIKNLLRPQGISIGFTGPDGVGKTTVMELVVQQLKTTFSGIEVFHFRPAIIPNLGDVMHDVGLKKEVDHNFDKPHRGKKTSKASSLIRLCYYILDYMFGYFFKVRRLLYCRNIVVFDRYYTDIITDSHRSRIFLPSGFIRWMRWAVPPLRYNFLITAEAEIILDRKKELDMDGIHAVQSKMAQLDNCKNYFTIQNNGTPQEAVSTILKLIYSEQDCRYRK